MHLETKELGDVGLTSCSLFQSDRSERPFDSWSIIAVAICMHGPSAVASCEMVESPDQGSLCVREVF